MIGKFKSIYDNIKYILEEMQLERSEKEISDAVKIRSDFAKQSLNLKRVSLLETLSSIKKRGFKIGLISDCSPDIPEEWDSLEYCQYFDSVIFSCEVGMKKPNPKIYQKSIDSLNVNFDECYYIGDGGSNELTGAQNVGMYPILIKSEADEKKNIHKKYVDKWTGERIFCLSELMNYESQGHRNFYKENVNIENELKELLRSNEEFMNLLRAVRGIGLKDWYIGAGCIRGLVWDYLHNFQKKTEFRDIDVVYFDDILLIEEEAANTILSVSCPGYDWEVTNQAFVHEWYETKLGIPTKPLTSTADAISTWPETATCIGATLLENDEIEICAPHGLDDLFNMVLRWNPKRATKEIFDNRIKEKRLCEKWPIVTVV